MHCFWEKFGWCKGMIFEFEATNNNCQFPCLIVHDDGEEEKVDFPDDTVKDSRCLMACMSVPVILCRLHCVATSVNKKLI